MVDIQRLGFIVLEQETPGKKLDASDVNDGLNSRLNSLSEKFVTIYNATDESKKIPSIWGFFQENGISIEEIESISKKGTNRVFDANGRKSGERKALAKGIKAMNTWFSTNSEKLSSNSDLTKTIEEYNSEWDRLELFLYSTSVTDRAGRRLKNLKEDIISSDLGGTSPEKINGAQEIHNLVDNDSLIGSGLKFQTPNEAPNPGGGVVLKLERGGIKYDLQVGADKKIVGAARGNKLIGNTHLAKQDSVGNIKFEKLKISTDFECKTPGWTISDLTPSLDATGVLSYGMKFTNGAKNFRMTGLKSDGTLTSPFVAQDTKNEYTLTGGGRNFEITEKPLPVQPEDPTPAPGQLDPEEDQSGFEKTAISGVLDLLAKINVETSPINNKDDVRNGTEYTEGPVTYLQQLLEMLNGSEDSRFKGKIIGSDPTAGRNIDFVDSNFGPRTFASVKKLQEILFGETSPEVDGLFGKKTKAKLEMELGTTSALVPKTSSTEAVLGANDGVADAQVSTNEADPTIDAMPEATEDDLAEEATDAGADLRILSLI